VETIRWIYHVHTSDFNDGAAYQANGDPVWPYEALTSVVILNQYINNIYVCISIREASVRCLLSQPQYSSFPLAVFSLLSILSVDWLALFCLLLQAY
jgi:hypothetical protein